jgi:hypothetical protein
MWKNHLKFFKSISKGQSHFKFYNFYFVDLKIAKEFNKAHYFIEGFK